MAGILDKVKKALGITGDYQNDTLTEYINEVKAYIKDAGVPDAIINSDMSAGVISRGVSDLWNYGTGKLSEYFYQRVSQLVYALDSGKYITFTAGDYGQSFPVNIEGFDIKPTDTVVFKCGEIEKTYLDESDNCILITFTQEESESLSTGTYNWTLKVQGEGSTVTLVNDGVLVVG